MGARNSLEAQPYRILLRIQSILTSLSLITGKLNDAAHPLVIINHSLLADLNGYQIFQNGWSFRWVVICETIVALAVCLFVFS